ncbi:MAG TPA: DNA topoisomerase IV subunit B, partial [Thermoanaerobaculia bacterium]|nr:DNA topoisomerase IV subunit B [Thermoanaerobaculia bacterium]
VYYALDEREKKGILDRLEAEGKKGKPNVQRFKGLGEMNPLQLRETTLARETRRLVQLTLEGEDGADNSEKTEKTIDMLLAKARAGDRKEWMMKEGNRAEVEV